MFGKVLKYDFRDGLRTFLPLWIAVIVIAFINGFTINLSESDTAGARLVFIVAVVLAWVLVIGTFVLALIMIIRRFYGNLLGEGAYLSFSLPVRAETHVGSKLLYSVIMLIGCTVAAVIAALIVLSMQSEGFLTEFGSFIVDSFNVVKAYPNSVIIIIEAIVFILLCISYGVLRLYSAMSVGHLFRNHRGLMSLIAYIVIGWLEKNVLTLIAIGSGNLFSNTNIFSVSATLSSVEQSVAFVAKSGVLAIVLALIGNVILWFVTTLILKKRLNIQ